MNCTFRQRTDKPTKDGRCYLFADVTWPGGRATLPTGVKCLPAHFKPGKSQPVGVKDPECAASNTRLASIQAKLAKAASRATTEEYPLTTELLRAAIANPRAAKAVAAPVLVTPTEFHAAWAAENPSTSKESMRRYKQAVSNLEAYRANWPITTLTRAELHAYLAHAATLGLVDSTVTRHIKFIRECFRLAGKPVPTWLKLQVRYGRSPALQAQELRQLIKLPLFEQPALEKERDLFLFQAMLLLRDSDLRQVRPHHITAMQLPQVGQVLVLSLRQVKTGDEVRLPLPPLAAAIWEKYAGQLPVSVQQYRNRHMKQLMERAGLTRDFVRVRYVQGNAVEEVVPLWQVITTHTARHTGADMIMLGSGGDSNLKEKALGHASVYGHDALERYGPLLLAAWAQMLSTAEMDNKKAVRRHRVASSTEKPKRQVRQLGDYNSPQLYD